MVKVVMTSAAGCKSDLFSEHALLREVFEQFHEDCAGVVNGDLLQQEDFDKPLLLFGREAEVWITSVPKKDKSSEEVPVSGSLQYGCSEWDALTALHKARVALDEAIKGIEALGIQLIDDESPF